MKFLVDENIGLKVVKFLNLQGHITEHIQNIQIGIEDYQILNLSVLKNSIVITFDKDFGELIFKEGKRHNGVIFLRLEDQTSKNVVKVLKKVLSKDNIERNFVIVNEKDKKLKIKITKTNLITIPI